MIKILLSFLIISFVVCVIINAAAFVAEKIMKKKTIKDHEEKTANKEE